MKRISPEAFGRAIKADPAWASKLTEDLEVGGIVTMKGTNVSHLSPHLHFPHYVSIRDCPQLKKLEGHFGTMTDFTGSGIEEIGDVTTSGSHPSKLRCDLSKTPFYKKDPMKAATVMTGSADPKVWEKVRKNTEKALWHTAKYLEHAINLAKKKKLMESLQKQNPNALEI
jgi:hypothetical protein